MSRLTKEQAMSLYGRNLPTPIIEKMTLLDVKNDDEYLESLADLRTIGLDPLLDSVVTNLTSVRDRVVSSTTRVDLDISFYLQTWEGFDVNELTRELFEKITTAPGETGTTDTSDSLFINAAITFPTLPGAARAAEPARRKNKIDLLSMFYDATDRLINDQFAKLSLQSSYNIQNQMRALVANQYASNNPAEVTKAYEVSQPLSDFYEVAELTAQYDADDNPIIKISNIKLTFYIANFTNHPNITFYTAVSTAPPVVLGSQSPLDPISYSMNFSDLGYEDLVKRGSLSTISEPVFVDSAGVYYPNLPLRALNKKYYKIDDYGPKQIIDQTNVLLGEYRKYLATDSQLLDAVNQIKLLIQTQQDAVNFLQLLDRAGQVYSETNEVTRYSRFYERFRILVKNADATLRNQQEVVKRVYRNYKVVDARAFVPPPMDASSYVHELTDSRDYLYEQIFHSNVANFVPIGDTPPAGYPGRAELPESPSERLEQYATETEGYRRSVINLLMPAGGGFNYGGRSSPTDTISTDVYENAMQRVGATRLPWENKGGMTKFNQYVSRHQNLLSRVDAGSMPLNYVFDHVSFSATEIADMLGGNYRQDHPLDRAVLKIAWWIYHVWAGRLIQGSEHKGYRDNSDYDGVHWYVAKSEYLSLDYVDLATQNVYTKWTQDNGYKQPTVPPDRWERLVQSLVPGESYTPAPVKHSNDEGGVATTQEPPTHHAPPSADAEWVLDNFGFSTDGTAASEENLPHRNLNFHAGARVYHGNPAFWYWTRDDDTNSDRLAWSQYWLNPFFWTACHEKEVWSMTVLGKLEEQVSFYVPTRALGADGSRVVADTAADSTVTVDSIADLTDYTMTYGAGPMPPEWVNELIDERWERIGGVRGISSNVPTYGSGEFYTSNAYKKGSFLALADDPQKRPPFVRVKRRKLKNIYNDVKPLIMNLFGMDESGIGTAGGPEEEDASSTNPMTQLDTYLQEMPGAVANDVSNKLFDRLESLPYSDFDTPYDISQEANRQIELVHAEYIDAMDQFLSKDLCSIYIATSPPPEASVNRRNIVSGDTETAADLFFARVDNDYIGGVQAARGQQTVVPYGQFGIPAYAAVKHIVASGVQSRQDSEVWKLDFGDAIKQVLHNSFLQTKETIKERIKSYLNSRQELEGFQSDVGIHSTLAEVDIVLKKYGYFFFDLEKYIRKRSFMSRVINVDRLIGYMDSGQEITNAAVRFENAAVALNNFGSRPEASPYAELNAPWNGDPPMPRGVMISLTSQLNPTDGNTSPTSFKQMNFKTIEDEEGQPIVYRKIDPLSEIRFDQISEYTNNPGYGSGELGMPGQEKLEDATRGGALPQQDFLPGGDLFQFGFFDGDYSAYGAADADAMATDYAISVVRGQEVDMDAVIAAHPKQVDAHTKLELRNYGFGGFSNVALDGGQTWVDNYRLMCFKYQFFMDDDLAYSNNAHEEYEDTLNSVDDVKITIEIRDRSREVVKALCDKYSEEYLMFLPYFEAAKENCAFDAFDQRFNKFFADAMLHEYPNKSEQPWFRMAATYVMMYNLFSDTYAGNRSKMEEAANNILETIRPETGTLDALINFKAACDILNEMLRTAEADVDDVENGFAIGEEQPLATFEIYQTLASPVIDHIGDYTQREEAMEREF